MSRAPLLGLAGLAVLALALPLLAPGPASAHGRSTSVSSWRLVEDGGRVLVRVQWRDLQIVLPELAGVRPPGDAAAGAAIDAYLVDRVALYAGGERCAATGPPLPVPAPGPTHVARAWSLRCEADGPLELRIAPFLEAAPSHLHLARVTLPDGSLRERVFVLEDTVYRPLREAAGAADAPDPAGGSGFVDYLALGVEHIASGVDHLTFLLALLLIGVSLGEMAAIVTGFTLAHSLTLAFGVLGALEPQAAAVESLIGFSIAVVALENFALTTGAATGRWIVASLALAAAGAALGAVAGVVAVPALALVGVGIFSVAYLRLLPRLAEPQRLRWLVALVFGLVHGLGFAGLLAEIGFPTGRLVSALLGFNLGVELGQLAIVAAVWPLLRLALRRSGARAPLLVQLGSAPVLVAGLYWFLTRALGG